MRIKTLQINLNLNWISKAFGYTEKASVGKWDSPLYIKTVQGSNLCQCKSVNPPHRSLSLAQDSPAGQIHLPQYVLCLLTSVMMGGK